MMIRWLGGGFSFLCNLCPSPLMSSVGAILSVSSVLFNREAAGKIKVNLCNQCLRWEVGDGLFV